MYAMTYSRGSNAQSVEDQQERLIKALPPEYEVVGSYSDTGSAMNEQRPGLTAALDHLEAGGVQFLCVLSLDRLTRKPVHLFKLICRCSEVGCVIQDFPESGRRS